jgi:predicted DNA-binding WGR domain protein
MSAVHLIRIDPACNMRRFYRLDVQPDLFGGFAVVKEWGRIGARGGRVAGEWHLTVALAVAAVQRQAKHKRRRGYSPGCPNIAPD